MNKEPSKRKVGRPPFVPTDEDRAVVKLLVACGMSQDRVCLRVRGNEGKPISEATLKRHFARELLLAKVEVETIVLTQFMAAINRGERWAILDQRMWWPESGAGRACSRLSEAIIERRPTSATTARSLQLSFFERSEHRLLVSRFDVDHPVRREPGRSD